MHNYRGKRLKTHIMTYQPGGLIDLGKYSPTQMVREEDVVAPPNIMQNPVPTPNMYQQGIQKGIIEPEQQDPSDQFFSQQYQADPFMQQQYDNSLFQGIKQSGSRSDKQQYRKWYNQKYNKASFNPTNVGATIQYGVAAASELSGIVARGRQNQYDMAQQRLRNYENAMPVSGFQPTAYNPYAEEGGEMRYGGLANHKYFGPPFANGRTKLKEISDEDRYDKRFSRRIVSNLFRNLYKKEYGGLVNAKYIGPAYSNDSPEMDMTNAGIIGNEKKTSKKPPPPHKTRGTAGIIKQRGGMVAPNVVDSTYLRKRLSLERIPPPAPLLASVVQPAPNPEELARMRNRPGQLKAMVNKKGGTISPNKAREILHDGTANGKKLTKKQRGFFGAKSKGHTNYGGK